MVIAASCGSLPMNGSPAMHFSYSVIIAENVFPYKNTNLFSKMQDSHRILSYGLWQETALSGPGRECRSFYGSFMSAA